MSDAEILAMVEELADGRTDLVFDVVAAGVAADTKDQHGVSLIQHCGYFGDVSAIKFLLSHGESLDRLGSDIGLNAAAYHGHWRLCKFLLQKGAEVNAASPDTGETPLHNVLCKTDRIVYDRVMQVLLSYGADPNRLTKPGVETGGFMRDCRTKGESPLHRAAAFGNEGTIKMLLDAGAVIDARDMNGDTPLSWASWYLRSTPILRLLCYGEFRIHPQNREMQANLLGDPHN